MSDCGDVKKVFVPESKTDVVLDAPTSGILISGVAALKIKHFVEQKGQSIEAYGLKVYVKKDGCSGHSYSMEIEEIASNQVEGAKIFSQDGATFMVDKTSYFFLTGSILDYTEALTGSGFTLNNPNIKRTCSCGSSFSV